MTARESVIGGAIAAVGVLSMFLGWARAAANWARALVVTSVWLELEAHQVVSGYLLAHGRRHGADRRTYVACTRYVTARGRSEVVPWEEANRESSLTWLGWRPVWLTRQTPPLLENFISFKLSVLRWMDVEKLICAACAWASAHVDQDVRHHVRYHYGRSLRGHEDGTASAPSKTAHGAPEDLHGMRRLLAHSVADFAEPESALSSLDSLVMTAEVARLTQDVRRWHADREWYTSHGIPWRMGVLLDGGPGSGKTTLARALAVELDLPVHVFDLATMSNEDLRTAWSAMAATAPCMALVEDVDRVFHGDRNVAPQGGLSSGGVTFNALLNAIDGIERHDGVLLVVTTNHLDRVDPALRDRPGRIDQVVHFGLLDAAARGVLARRIVDDPVLAEKLVLENLTCSTSAFVAACCAAACRARYQLHLVGDPMRTSSP